METASPAESSAGEVILEPDESRARDLLNALLDWPSNNAEFDAETFVLMTILTPSMSHLLRGDFYLTASLPFGGFG
jgi:hypothetical protein